MIQLFKIICIILELIIFEQIHFLYNFFIKKKIDNLN